MVTWSAIRQSSRFRWGWGVSEGVSEKPHVVLVIGIAAYQYMSRLNNPGNDAYGMASALEKRVPQVQKA